MATKKLKINKETDMFGTTVWLETPDGSKKWNIGTGVSFDPTVKMTHRMPTGYLFRSPKTDVNRLSEIWDTVEFFTGKIQMKNEYDDKADSITTYVRIENKSDATMFAFAHNTFEKWSDEKDAEEKARLKEQQKAINGTVNDDGTVRVTVEVETLGD